MGFVTEAGLANVIAAWNAYAERPLYLQGGSGSGQGQDAVDVATPVQDRIAGVTSQETTNIPGDTLKIVGSLLAAADDTMITELGLFDAAINGSMAIYGDDFAPLDLAAGDAAIFSVSVVVSQV